MRILKRTPVTLNQVAQLVGTDAELEAKRQARRKLLTAFDVWEKAVIRGRETDSAVVMAWYKDLLDLKTSAFTNIPVAIKKHMDG